MTTYEELARWTYAYLNQGDVWFPKGKPAVSIPDMDAEWRYNASRLLERTATELVNRYTWGEIIAMNRPKYQAIGWGEQPDGPALSELDLMSDSVADGWEAATDARDHDPVGWVRGTKLYEALVAGLPTKRRALRRLAKRAKHWSTCPARTNAGLCRCDDGITTEYAQANGEPAAQAIEMVAYWVAHYLLGRIPTVACNAPYDFTLLDRECRRHDLPTVEERLGRPIAPVVDVHVLDKHIDPYRKGSRTLDALRQHYQVRHDGLHDAITDALAAARVAYRIALMATGGTPDDLVLIYGSRRPAGRLVELANVSAAQLHRLQIGWRAEQCDSLRAHFNRKGIEHDGVVGDWPILTIPVNSSEAMPV